MGRYTSRAGDEAECIQFASETDQGLEGPWYHATSQARAKGLSDGTVFFETDKGRLRRAEAICFTRDEDGAAKNRANWLNDRWIITAYIKANRPNDPYQQEQHDISGQNVWLFVEDVRCIMVKQGSVRERNKADEEVPL